VLVSVRRSLEVITEVHLVRIASLFFFCAPLCSRLFHTVQTLLSLLLLGLLLCLIGWCCRGIARLAIFTLLGLLLLAQAERVEKGALGHT
jgi:hypothetical protein